MPPLRIGAHYLIQRTKRIDLCSSAIKNGWLSVEIRWYSRAGANTSCFVFFVYQLELPGIINYPYLLVFQYFRDIERKSMKNNIYCEQMEQLEILNAWKSCLSIWISIKRWYLRNIPHRRVSRISYCCCSGHSIFDWWSVFNYFIRTRLPKTLTHKTFQLTAPVNRTLFSLCTVCIWLNDR